VGAVATVAAALAWSAYIRAHIRGHTGDTLGAGCELAETVLLLVFAGLRGG
jgi:cobalamin synthase